MINLRPLSRNDFFLVKEFISQGRRYQNTLGFEQWLEGYPSDDLLETDFSLQRGYIIEVDDEEAGYVVIDLNGDPEYDRLSQIWTHKGRYAVVHRLVLNDRFRGRGLATALIEVIEEHIMRHGISIVRFDTGVKNIPMQRLLTRCDYDCRGSYAFIWGERLAYEKLLPCT